jgi:type IV secretion system protein VirB1
MLPTECEPALRDPLFQQIVRTESGGNPHAIGVVAGQLLRQPTNLPEAVATARALDAAGRNYSVGLAQVNRAHFARLGWSGDIGKGFDRCHNARAGAQIFNDCYRRALASGHAAAHQGSSPATEAALSCYFSGNFVTGIRLGYVAKVLGVSASPPVGSGSRRSLSMMPSFDE